MNRILSSILVSARLLEGMQAIEASASAPEVRLISADVQKVKGPHSTAFRFAVGAGRAKEGLQPEWQRQLKICREELGFAYLRCHGVFHDDMRIYTENSQGQSIYHWEDLDAFYDYLLSIGVRPFVELSTMPSALALNKNQKLFWWNGIMSPPRSYERWEELVGQFTRHVTQRYGAEEVATWYFEVWNEPNLPSFWSGTKEDYFRLYRYAAKAIKEVNPRYRVGGPSTAGCAWIKEMAEFCERDHVPLDFLSTHTYGKPWGQAVHPDMQSAGRDMQNVRRRLDEVLPGGRELHFTEWNSSWEIHELLRDTYVQAPYVLEQIKQAEHAVTSMPYWAFTDIFEEGGVPTQAFHGGFGLLTIDGIRKPAYFAYRFANLLGDRELENADSHSWVCLGPRGDLQVLAWDISVPKPAFSASSTKGTVTLSDPEDRGPVRIRVANVSPGAYTLKAYRIGPHQNDPYSLYMQFRAPERPAESQLKQLQDASRGEPLETRSINIGSDGIWEASLPLSENQVVFTTLNRDAE